MSTGSAIMLPRLSAPATASYWCLQALDERRPAPRRPRGPGGRSRSAYGVRLGAQGVGDLGQHQAGGRGDRLQDRERGVRVRGAGDVVRDVGGDAQDVVAGLRQPLARSSASALPGTWASSNQAAVAGHQVDAVAVRGEADRAGVRDAHRDAVEVDGRAGRRAARRSASRRRRSAPTPRPARGRRAAGTGRRWRPGRGSTSMAGSSYAVQWSRSKVSSGRRAR